MVNERIAHYKIKRKVGSGGMATVYEAVDLRNNQARVALKVLHAHLADQTTYVARFEREAKTALAFNSPHIVKVLEYGADRGHHFLAMEFVRGVTLQQFLQQHGALGVSHALDVVDQAAEALEEANRHGVVHRDIKPQNIMITPEGAIKVMDFGIARGGLMESMTLTGMFVGTPHYSSPEQAMGEAVDIRSDLYSLGVVLYQLLTGTVPFQADTPQALLLRVMQGNPVSVQALRIDLNPSVVAIVDKLLQQQKDKRFTSPTELRDALRPLLGSNTQRAVREEMATIVAPLVPLTAAPRVSTPTPRYSNDIAPKRSFPFALVGAAAALTVLLLLTLFLWRPWAPRTEIASQQATAEVDPGHEAELPPTSEQTPVAIAKAQATKAPTAAAPATESPTLTAISPAVTNTPKPVATDTRGDNSASVSSAASASAKVAARTPTVTSMPSETPTLAPVELLGPADGSRVTANATLRWQPLAGAASYRVETRPEKQNRTEWREWPEVKQPEFKLIFAQAADYFKSSGNYLWRVVALDAGGDVLSTSAQRRLLAQLSGAPTPTTSSTRKATAVASNTPTRAVQATSTSVVPPTNPPPPVATNVPPQPETTPTKDIPLPPATATKEAPNPVATATPVPASPSAIADSSHVEKDLQWLLMLSAALFSVAPLGIIRSRNGKNIE